MPRAASTARKAWLAYWLHRSGCRTLRKPLGSTRYVNSWSGSPFHAAGREPSEPDLQHYGAGETICKPKLAAVADAVFDATGVRMRRVPLTAARVLAALRT